MDSDQDNFFVTGGTLPTDAPSYIERRADHELLEALQSGEYCYVLDTRQMGKSSLMVRAAARLREQDVNVCVIDLTAIGRNLSIEQWYLGMVMSLGGQLGCDLELLDAWRQNRELGSFQRFVCCLRVALAWLTAHRPDHPRLVLFIDEIDAVRGLAFSADEFFIGIRECYNRRSHDPIYNHLTVCLLGVASPTDLIRETLISPFNIGRRIVLTDFREDEARTLRSGLAGPPSRIRRLLRRILYWTGGHPYMTQRLCQAVAEQPQMVAPVQVDRLCRDLFLSRNAIETDDNLAFARNRLLNSVSDLAGLLEMYARIRRGKRVDDDPADPYCATLQLAGVVRSVNGRLRVRNRIYERVFDGQWILLHMPDAELRRQRSAYRRGLWRATGFACAILTALSALAVMAFRQADLAVKAQRQLSLTLSRNLVANGIRLAEEGDPLAALTLLSESLRLDGADPARAQMDRYRIAAALQQVPQLDQIWVGNAPISVARFSADGRRVLIARHDGVATLYDAASGRATTPAMRHPGILKSASLSPDGRYAATCGEDGYARIWDAATGVLLHALKQDQPVVSVSWSPDGRRIGVASRGRVTICEAATGRSLLNLAWPEAQIVAYLFTADGNRVVMLASNYLTCVFDLVHHTNWFVRGFYQGKRTGCFDGAHAEFSRDGRHLLIAGALAGEIGRGGVFLFDFGPERRPITLLSETGMGTDARFSPDGRRIVTADASGLARVWNVGASLSHAADLHHPAGVRSAAFSPDGRLVATNCDDGIVRVWDATTGALQHPLIRHAGPIETVEFAPTGRRLLTAGRDGTVRIWDLASRSVDEHALAQFDSVGRVDFTSLPRFLIQYRKGQRGYGAIWDTDSARSLLTLPADGYKRLVRRQELAAITTPNGISLRRVADGTPLLRRLIPTRNAADISPLGRFCCRYERGGVLVIETATDRIVGRSLPASSGSWAFSPDERNFVAIDEQGVMREMDTASGRCLPWSVPLATTPSDVAYHAQFGPDGRYLCIWSTQDRSFQIRDAQTGALVAREQHASGGINVVQKLDGSQFCVTWGDHFSVYDIATARKLIDSPQVYDASIGLLAAYSPSGRRLAICNAAVSIWDTQTGRQLTPYQDLNSEIDDAAFSPDERFVVTISKDSAMRIWNAATGAPASPPTWHPGRATSAVFSPDGRFILVTSNYQVDLWDARTNEPAGPTLLLPAPVWKAWVSADARQILVVCDTGIYQWNVTPDRRPTENLLALTTLLAGRPRDRATGADSLKPDAILASWQRIQRDQVEGLPPFAARGLFSGVRP
jgi:WD40 repeat protein